MFCTSCGAELRPGSKFCGGCGTPVAAAAAPVEAPVIETPAEPVTPAPAYEAPVNPAPACEAPVNPAPTQFAQPPYQAPVYAALQKPVRAKSTGFSIVQILLLLSATAALALLFLGIFGYEVEPDYSNRFSAFGLCAPFIDSEISLAGIWNILIFVAAGVALIGLVGAALALLVKKPMLNILPIVSGVLVAAFSIVCFFAFSNALTEFLTNYVTEHHMTHLTGYALLTEVGIALLAVCGLNVILGIAGIVLGSKAAKTPAYA